MRPVYDGTPAAVECDDWNVADFRLPFACAFRRPGRKTVLLLDSRKFSRRAAAVTLHPRRLHALVTDRVSAH